MARPADKEYRAEILGALDLMPIMSLPDVIKHLQQSRTYSSVRRMVVKMEGEGLLTIHEKRGAHNAMLLSKGVVIHHLALKSQDGRLTDLDRFLSDIFQTEFPSFVKESSGDRIVELMLDYILASDPALFTGIRDVPDRAKILRTMEKIKRDAGKLHALMEFFLRSDIHSPVHKVKIKSELEMLKPGFTSALVTRSITRASVREAEVNEAA